MAIATAALGLTSVLMSGMAAAHKGLNEAKRIRSQNAARIKQMSDQFTLSTQNLHNNNVSIRQQKMKNSVLIEESKLEAQDAFSQAFIGAGVSGRTKDVMAASMQNEVSKAHNQNAEEAQESGDRQFLGLMRQSANIKSNIENFESFDVSANNSNINMAMMSSAVSQAGNGAFNSLGDISLKSTDNGTTGFQSFKNTKFTNTFSGNTRGSSRGIS